MQKDIMIDRVKCFSKIEVYSIYMKIIVKRDGKAISVINHLSRAGHMR